MATCFIPHFAFLLFQAADGMKALEEQRYEAAAQAFEKAAAASPSDYSAHFHLGLAYTMLKRDAEAAAAYRKVLDLKPGLYEAELNLGMVLLRSNQAAEAARYLESAAEKKPKEFRPALYSGDAWLAAGDAVKAEPRYRAAAELDPKSAPAEHGLGRALAKQRKLTEAEPHFRKAAELDPAYKEAQLELAALFEAAKHADQAAAIYSQFPDNAGAQERLGQLWLEAGKIPEAVRALEAAVSKSPTDANRFALATAYLANKQASKALPLLEQALAAGNAGYETRMVYARVLRDAKDYPKAAQEFLRAAQLKPDSAEAWSDLAGMLILLNQDQQALAALDKIRALGAEKPGHHYLRAIVLDRNKQHKPALESYQRFLAVSDGKSPDEEFKARQRVRILEKETGKR